MQALLLKNEYKPNAKTGDGFLAECSFPYDSVIAFEKDGFYYAISGGNPILFKKTDSNTTLRDWLCGTFGTNEFRKVEISPGIKYRRIWKRGLVNTNPHPKLEDESLNQASIALTILLSKLEELFTIIEPDPINLLTFGHKIREILMLASMEVESSWSAVLRENGYTQTNKPWNTNDYVKLKDPMLLDTFAISLKHHPRLAKFEPFKNWNATDPTKSIPWYDAYHKTKHNRESFLSTATLENTINAVGAAVIMFYAQFGPQRPGLWTQISTIDTKIRSLFMIGSNDTTEKKIERLYIPLIEIKDGKACTSIEWTTTNYPFN